MSDAWSPVILESVSDGVLLAGPDWRIRLINPAAERLLQVRREDVVGRVLGRDFCPVGRREIAAFRDVMTTRRGRALRNVRLVNDARSELRFDAQVDACEDGGIVAVFRDVTERARLEESARTAAEQARAAAQAAEAANRAKSEFLATMSHELRTPLNAIVGYIELLEIQLAGPLTDQQRGYLERLRMSSQHLLGIISDVLDLAKIDAGRLTVSREVEQVSRAVEAALALLRPEAASRGLLVSVDCAEDPALAYIGDEDRVRQILVNLLSNAVKFTEPGGRITVACGWAGTADSGAEITEPGSAIYVRVTDTGIGMSPEQLAVIFEPFIQAEAGHTRRRGGTGLGLTISRRLARLMGGDLTVESGRGKGSTFTLWLPAALGGEGAVTLAAHALRPQQGARIAGLREVGELLADKLNDVVHAYVHRLRELPIMPQAAVLPSVDLEDHVASFLADVFQLLEILEHTGGEPSAIIRDGSDVQRLIAERHGAQRRALGWTEDALRREFDLMYEELAGAAREVSQPEMDVEGALGVVRRLLDHAGTISLRGFRHAGGNGTA